MKKNRFEEYPIGEEIVTALNHLRYVQPTEVQQEVVPAVLDGQDIIVEAQTGSGKTASYGIPLIERVVWEENKPQALILVPTRELALQVKEELTNIGRLKRIKSTAVFGKASFETQKSELRQKSHLVVGTPGRVLDHLQKGTLKVGKIRYLVLDEADEMLNMGFIDQVEAIIDFLAAERQTLLFSATIGSEVERLAGFHMKPDPVLVRMASSKSTKPAIQQSFVRVEEARKKEQLLDLIVTENPDSCLVFCNTQEMVNQLNSFLDKAGLPVDKIHGGMVQEDRFAVMDDFRKGRLRYLVATDVAARGIDIEQVTHVINFDVPVEKESFVHRTGRTGRAGRTGKALTLVTDKESRGWQEIREFALQEVTEIALPNIRSVERHRTAFQKKLQERPVIKKARNQSLNKDITKVYFNGGKKKKLRAVDFVGTIVNIPGVEAEDIGIITIQENVTYVDILNGKGPLVIEAMKERTVKGKQLKVHKARKK